VSTVETPPPDHPTGRQCPRCGAAMTDEQEWCLACGAAVGTRVVAAPGWRAPIAIAGVIVVIAAIAVAVAIIQLADDTGQVAQNPPAASPTPPAAATPAPSATPDAGLTPDPSMPEASGQSTPEPTTTPEPSTTPEATTTPDSSGSATAEWPSGKSGWTVVLASDPSESEAQDAADKFAGDGISGVGVLHSNDFSSLKPGYWVVFSGQYDSQSAASDALDGIDAKDAYIRRIEPN
jgi:septal ring-binding cell division protein DamX